MEHASLDREEEGRDESGLKHFPTSRIDKLPCEEEGRDESGLKLGRDCVGVTDSFFSSTRHYYRERSREEPL